MNGDLFDSDRTYAFPPPRECQVRAIEALREGLRAGHRNQLLVLPTGGGKTIASLMLIAESLKKGKRATFVCDRITLINQASENADKYGLNHGIVQANHWRRDNSQQFQIASVQTIQKREYWPPADLVVIDEAHNLQEAHRELLLAKKVPIIGLTATPCTKGLGKYFTNVVNAATMHELTEAGVLVPMYILSCSAPDMTGAETNAKGEWTEKAASEREAKIIGDVVGEWIAHGENCKTIAFGADIAYCNLLVQRFNAAEVNAAAYTSDTTDAECRELLNEFRKPDSSIRVLVSVEKLAKGFDVPDVGCVIDARPLRKSLSTAIQMWGRGLRSAPGKKRCILLDFTRNIVRFMPDFEDVYFNGFRTLSDAEKLDSKPRESEDDYTPAGCPNCNHKPFNRRCLACGFEKPTQALEDTTVGEMREISIGSGKNRKVLAADDFDLWRQVCGYARTYSKPERQEMRARNLFRNILGRWPPRDYNFYQTEPAPVGRNTRNKIKSLDIAWRAAQKKTPPEIRP